VPSGSFYARLGRLSAIIFILPASMSAGAALGYYVADPLLGTSPWATIVLTLLFAGSGFYQIIQLLTQDARDRADPPAD
jgi:F0F1-type ATP synthase assembly protein I